MKPQGERVFSTQTRSVAAADQTDQPNRARCCERAGGIGRGYPGGARNGAAGALSTGTHGTGITLGCLSSQAVGMRLVQADGSVLEVDIEGKPVWSYSLILLRR